MEALQKTVIISCLIYGLYGFISLLELGHFIPPLPLKPFLFLVLLIAFLLDRRIRLFSAVNIVLLLWLGSLILKGQFFIETLFDYNFTLWYLESIEPYIFLISNILFVLLILYFVKENKGSLLLVSGLSMGILLLFLYSFYTKSHVHYDWIIVVISLFIFVISLFTPEIIKKDLKKSIIVFYGVGVITLIEQMTYMLS